MSYQRRVPFSHPGFDDFPPHPSWPMRTRDPAWDSNFPSSASRPSRFGFDPSFGDALRDDEFFSSRQMVPRTAPGGYYVTHPGTSRDLTPMKSSGDMQLTSTEFKVAVDAKNFKPEELDVKIVDDEVIIHGKHEEKSDSQGSVSREFTRRYKLPADVDPADIISALSEDGVLSIRGPRKGSQAAPKSIPISIQGKPALKQGEAAKK